MARADRRYHLRRRHPRSHRPQNAPDQSHRTQPAPLTRQQAIPGLTAPYRQCKKLSASLAPDPGRHHGGTPSDIISERPGDFVGIRTRAPHPARSANTNRPKASLLRRSPLSACLKQHILLSSQELEEPTMTTPSTGPDRAKIADKNADQTGSLVVDRQAAMLVVDLGKARRKQIKRLRKGQGKLAEHVQRSLAELKSSGNIPETTQTVIVIVREKRRRIGLFG